jgi:hypothetical protein
MGGFTVAVSSSGFPHTDKGAVVVLSPRAMGVATAIKDHSQSECVYVLTHFPCFLTILGKSEGKRERGREKEVKEKCACFMLSCTPLVCR